MHTDNHAVSVCFGADDFVNHDFLLFISFDNKKGRQLRSYAYLENSGNHDTVVRWYKQKAATQGSICLRFLSTYGSFEVLVLVLIVIIFTECSDKEKEVQKPKIQNRRYRGHEF